VPDSHIYLQHNFIFIFSGSLSVDLLCWSASGGRHDVIVPVRKRCNSSVTVSAQLCDQCGLNVFTK